MCGLCGIVYTSHANQAIDPSILRKMTRTLIHRGPDDEGLWIDGPVGLGFRRLAIIDLDGGKQPMSNPQETIRLVFNGEIYNFREIRETLSKEGYPFRTHSDTETIIALYEKYGADCVTKLRGMFAFALWDCSKKRLLLARDRLGKKPLVYAPLSNGILFASELKALLEHPAIHPQINFEAIDLYLTYQYIPNPHTIFSNIFKLPPAHYALWQEGHLTIQRYWDFSIAEPIQISIDEATGLLLEKLREAVKIRLVSDVPLGAFLSGGIDSSVIVGMMSEASEKPVKTYCIGFEEENYSEAPYARIVAKHFGCEHHEFVVHPNTIEILPRLAWHYGEPFADPSALPSFFVAQQTRKDVTVALNGDGGDENFGGYYRYAGMAYMRYWNHLPFSIRKALYKLTGSISQSYASNSELHHIVRLIALGAEPTPEWQYLDLINFFTESEKKQLYSPAMREKTQQLHAENYLFNFLHQISTGTSGDINRYLAYDLHAYIPECLMVKMDIASMANSLETRSPFLDHEFVELAARIPFKWKWKPLLQTKWILKQGLRNWLPEEILNRRKQGFGIPLGPWFRGKLRSYAQEVIMSPQALQRGYFDPAYIQQIFREHQKGEKDHGYHLWSLLMLELWHQVYIDKTYHF